MDYNLNYNPALKKYFGWATTPLLLGIILSSFAFAFSYGVSGWKEMRDKNKSIVRQLAITGEGKMATKPDLATFTAGVVTQAPKIKDAQLENTRKSNAMLDFLKQKGLEEKDLKTVGYSIYPQYSYPEPCPRGLPGYDSYPCLSQKTPKIISYEVRHTIEVKVRDLDKVDELLEGVVSNGANEVGSVNFSVENEEKVKAEARKKAIDNAREKALVLAKDLGVRLGKIVSFSESGGGFPIYAQSFEALKGGGGVASVPSPRVEPGEQEIHSIVTLTYEFK